MNPSIQNKKEPFINGALFLNDDWHYSNPLMISLMINVM